MHSSVTAIEVVVRGIAKHMHHGFIQYPGLPPRTSWSFLPGEQEDDDDDAINVVDGEDDKCGGSCAS